MRNEMITLIDKLQSAHIPFEIEFQEMFSGKKYPHVMYPSNWEDDCKCSVICHECSYGGEYGLLEIMGLLTEEEKESDEVVGWLTANDVFARIYTDYINSAD
jgi:hypothetical protein